MTTQRPETPSDVRSACLLTRVSLGLSAAVFGGFGLLFLVTPGAVSETGIELTTDAARSEIRAFYGGLEIGIALFLLLAMMRPGWWKARLMVQILTLGTVGITRVFGFAIDGSLEPLLIVLMAAELGGSLFGLVVYRKLSSVAD